MSDLVDIVRNLYSCSVGVSRLTAVAKPVAMGGWGLDSRLWGLAMDNVESIKLVKADGSISTVSSSNEPDLYWAMRGAGPSFAIATEFKAKTYQAPPEVYHFELKLNLQNAQQAAKAFLAYVNWGTSADIPAGLGMQVSLKVPVFSKAAVTYRRPLVA
jgi:FAD/FMN-containing dehydrogenase